MEAQMKERVIWLLRQCIEQEKAAENPLKQVQWVRHFLHLRALAQSKGVI